MASLAGYMRFQIEHAEKPFLNVGVGANPCGWEGPGVVHVDLDRWRYHNFVQTDIHNLPFKDDSFKSVVAGDVLEHLVDPLKALQEMRRVAPKIVLTTFQEWRLGGPGLSIERGAELFAPDPKAFAPYYESGRCLAQTPESLLSHIPHINQWVGRQELIDLFTSAGLGVEFYEVDCPGIHEGHAMLNYLFVLRRC